MCNVSRTPWGAALTALYDACIRLVRGEDNELARDYFRAFKANFKKATLAWLLFLAAVLLHSAHEMKNEGLEFHPGDGTVCHIGRYDRENRRLYDALYAPERRRHPLFRRRRKNT